MKKIFLLLFLFSVSLSLHSQIVFKISEIRINYTYAEAEYAEASKIYAPEDLWYGPSIVITYSFENKTNSELKLYPYDARYYITYCYEDSIYIQEDMGGFAIKTEQDGSIILNPSEINEEIGVRIYLFDRTPMHQDHRYGIIDYRETLIKILPTLRFEYREKDRNISFITAEVDNVVVRYR